MRARTRSTKRKGAGEENVVENFKKVKAAKFVQKKATMTTVASKQSESRDSKKPKPTVKSVIKVVNQAKQTGSGQNNNAKPDLSDNRKVIKRNSLDLGKEMTQSYGDLGKEMTQSYGNQEDEQSGGKIILADGVDLDVDVEMSMLEEELLDYDDDLEDEEGETNHEEEQQEEVRSIAADSEIVSMPGKVKIWRK